MSKRRQVFVTDGAERDLESIHGYFCAAASPEMADRIQDRLPGLIGALGQLSERESIPASSWLSAFAIITSWPWCHGG